MTVAAVNIFGRHPLARIAIVAWIERVIPSPTELLILHLSSFFSTPRARGKAGGERRRRGWGGYREGEGISEGGKGGGGEGGEGGWGGLQPYIP